MTIMNAKMIEDLEVQLQAEFLGDAKDRLNSSQCALYAMAKDDTEQQDNLVVLHRELHALKGMGGTFGFPSVTLISHRLEDYLAELSDYGERAVSDIQVYLDRLADILESGEDLGDGAAEVLRGLPVQQVPGFDDIQLRDVDVLVVTPSRAVGQGVGRELRACGYRVTFAQTALAALEIAATVKPAMALSAASLDVLSGFDLVRGMQVMGATRGVRLGLLTSFDADHPELKALPEGVHVVRLGDGLRDDLGNMIADYESSAEAA